MKYIGGKHRLQKQITELITQYIEEGQHYYEPFVGGGWITQNIQNRKVYASDIDRDLILMYQEAQKGVDFIPDEIPEEMYRELKDQNINHGVHTPLIGFVKYGCSFGGKAWGGYSRYRHRDTTAVAESKRTLSKQMQKMQHVEFTQQDYLSIVGVRNTFIYCDPPYLDCSPDYCRGFDHKEFWEWARQLSKNNTVLVSEYVAPTDFDCILEIPTHLTIHPEKQVGRDRVEKVFKFCEN